MNGPLSPLDRELAAALARALVAELRTELSPTVINSTEAGVDDDKPGRAVDARPGFRHGARVTRAPSHSF